MINLIPPVVRKAVITEYWVRVISVWLFVVGVVSIMSAFFALPVYVLVSSQVDNYQSSAAAAASRVSEYDLSAEAMERANVMAQKIFELRKVARFSDAVSQIESLQSSAIVIDGYTFSRKDTALAPVIVTGKAETRQALASFREALLKEPNISDVVLPISNLAKDKDIQFSVSVTFKPAQ